MPVAVAGQQQSGSGGTGAEGGSMGKNDRHAEFEVKFIENNQIKITKDDCSIVTEYIEEEGVKRKTMSPADIFFAAFAL